MSPFEVTKSFGGINKSIVINNADFKPDRKLLK